MKLSPNDIAILNCYGYTKPEDIAQVEAVSKVLYISLFSSETATSGRRIGAEEACRLLGRDGFLGSFARASFHQSSCRDVPEPEKHGLQKGAYIIFDARRYFKPKKNGRYGRH